MLTIDRRRRTRHASASPCAPRGCDGAGPSAAFLLLNDATASLSSQRLASGTRGARNATALTRDTNS